MTPCRIEIPDADLLRDLRGHWRDGYDWRGPEAALNELPQVLVDGVPAVSMFPADTLRAPREYAERFLDVRQWVELDRGSHFAARRSPTCSPATSARC